MVITEKQALIMYDIVKSVLYSSTTENVAGYNKSDVKNLLNSVIEQCDDVENIVVKTIATSSDVVDFGQKFKEDLKTMEEIKDIKEKTKSTIEETIKEIETIVSTETLQKTVNTDTVTLDNPIGDEFDFGTPIEKTIVENTPVIKMDFNAAVGAMTKKPKTDDFDEIVDVTEKYKPIENVEVVVMKETEKINTSLFDEDPFSTTDTTTKESIEQKETKEVVVKDTKTETESEILVQSENTKVAVLSADEFEW